MRGVLRVDLKAHPGREGKRAPWVKTLHHYFRNEFDGLRELGVKFSVNTPRTTSLHLLSIGQSDAYSANIVDHSSGKTLTS